MREMRQTRMRFIVESKHQIKIMIKDLPGNAKSRRTPGHRRKSSRAAANPLVFSAHDACAIAALKPQNSEMTAGDRLEMIRKGIIDCRSARRADNGKRLGHELLGDRNTEVGADLRHKADKRWRGFVHNAAACKVARSFRHRFCQNGADGKIPGLQERALSKGRLIFIDQRLFPGGPGMSSKGKDLQTAENCSRVCEVMAFAARNISNRPQHDHCGKWQFDRKGREAESAPRRPSKGGHPFVQTAPVVQGLASKASKRHGKPVAHGSVSRPARSFRKLGWHHRCESANLLSKKGCQPDGEARSLKLSHRPFERSAVFRRKPGCARGKVEIFKTPLVCANQRIHEKPPNGQFMLPRIK
jgi:hypothetical protein